MALERAPISAGEFIGYRVWEVHNLNGTPTLRSWVYKCFWLPGGIVSDVTYTEPNVCFGPIDDDNQRGVWAFKTRELLEDDFRNYGLARALVYGTCYMWGAIIEHELGYRAQHARLLSIDKKVDGFATPSPWYYNLPNEPCDFDLDFLRNRYGVGSSLNEAE